MSDFALSFNSTVKFYLLVRDGCLDIAFEQIY